MDKTVRMALLFDFFGELLTERQREYFSLYYNENLTLSEIAENSGVSRQAVRDIVTRSEDILEDIESKTGLLGRFTEIQSDTAAIREALAGINALNSAQFQSGELSGLCGMISDSLDRLER